MIIKPHNDLIQVVVECLYRDLEEDDLKEKVKLFSDCVFSVLSPLAGVVLLLIGLGEYASLFGIASVDYLHSRYSEKKRF